MASFEGAIEGFRHHFGGEAVAGCQFVAAYNGSYTHLEYRIATAGGAGKTVVAYHDGSVDHMHLYDEFLGYFARSRRYALRIVEAIDNQDAEQLVRLLSVDDLDYPVELAGQAIESYASRFDSPGLELRYEGLEQVSRTEHGPDVNRWFVYSVQGTKGTEVVEHRVVMAHGDGLLGWRDPLVPEYHGE